MASNMATKEFNETVTHILDGTSIGTAVAAFFGWLPDIAALLTVIWLGIRVWESDTVQKLFNRDTDPNP